MRDDENNRNEGEEQLEFGPGDSWPPKDNLFADLDESEEFEESDRDSDFASIYTEVEEEEPDFPDAESEEQLDTVDPAADHTPWGDMEQDTAPPEPEQEPTTDQATWTALSALRSEDQGIEFEQPQDMNPDDDWEDDSYEDDAEREITLPLGLIAVGIIALVLLGAGGFGVMQDRAALQEEIRQLQASLANTASPSELSETRANSEALASRNSELEQQLADVARENRSLQSIIGGLETQLQAQQEALATAKKPPPAPAPKQAVSKPAPRAPASSAGVKADTGTWFVNFGSYSQRATAQSWVNRLQPGSGDVVVSTGEKDGRTFYRVRVINLASKEVADSTARKLEQDFELSRLWVGQTR
jgi:cell division septation protein DedD